MSRLIGKGFYIFIVDPAEVTLRDAIPLDWLIPTDMKEGATRCRLNIDNDPTTMCNVMDKCSNHLLSLLLL